MSISEKLLDCKKKLKKTHPDAARQEGGGGGGRVAVASATAVERKTER